MKDGDKCWVWQDGKVVEATFRGPLTYLIELPDGKQTSRLMAAILHDEQQREAFTKWHERQQANISATCGAGEQKAKGHATSAP